MKELINTIEQTMSSFEIAKITGKQHKHVMRDIRDLNIGYENLHLPKIGQMFKITELPNGAKRNDPYFELTKMQTFDLLTGYNTELRIKVNRRWAELEALTQIKMPKSLNVYGMEALPYVEWLLLHNYSVTSGQYHARIRKHPQHFYKSSTGKWYVNKAFAEQLLTIRQGMQALKEVKGLPQVHQVTLFEVLAEVSGEPPRANNQSKQ